MSVAPHVCINIGPAQRRLRSRMAMLMSAIAIVMAIAFVVTNTPRVMRLVIFAPLLMAALGVFQARAHTCVALAAKGLRNLDTGNEVIADTTEAAALKSQAIGVVARAVALAATLTAAALLA